MQRLQVHAHKSQITIVQRSNIDVFRTLVGSEVLQVLREVHVEARGALFKAALLGHRTPSVFQAARGGAKFVIKREVNELVLQAALTGFAFLRLP